MKDKLKLLAIQILLVSITFFSYGCTQAQRANLYKEVGEYIKEEGKNILAAAAAKADEVVEAKLAKAEKKKLDELDMQLALFSTKDPITGVENKITWKKFDGDGDNHLNAAELSSVGLFITTELAKKVASGEISKDDLAKHGKSAGLSLAALLAIWGAAKGVGMVAKKGKNGDGVIITRPLGPEPPDPGQST